MELKFGVLPEVIRKRYNVVKGVELDEEEDWVYTEDGSLLVKKSEGGYRDITAYSYTGVWLIWLNEKTYGIHTASRANIGEVDYTYFIVGIWGDEPLSEEQLELIQKGIRLFLEEDSMKKDIAWFKRKNQEWDGKRTSYDVAALTREIRSLHDGRAFDINLYGDEPELKLLEQHGLR